MILWVTMKALCKPYRAMRVRRVMLAVIKWPQTCPCEKGLGTEHEMGLQQSKDWWPYAGLSFLSSHPREGAE